ncbi:GNAT family N-acetyltransferase [Aurantimonas sp. MSK8Z-1]|uniref:GNAT family N-acetyltransferase n=1 Tax=Mangrovibrevibacter kandeliae TaxID=2968473 RepID=UPI00211870A1|nr:GNAT family N-acetyltransferase [Aurantimonas sp. MSK8Z-1]MCW4115114.1 GNAT family N-acetyltransferase [Aurantimonas sp. MSK8Z-1]
MTPEPPKGRKAGRTAFDGFAPAGYRIRMMEPGEAEALHRIDTRATLMLANAGKPDLVSNPLDRFVHFLLRHDVLVAAQEHDSAPAGFAAGAPLHEVYWLAELGVDPDHGRRGLGTALVRAVAARAGWFRHPAVALSTFADLPCGVPFYERIGFHPLAPKDVPPWAEARRREEAPPGSDGSDRVVMIRRL